MTSRERIARILKRQPVDRVGVFDWFWGEAYRAWPAQAGFAPGESLENHFALDLRTCGAFNLVADLDFKDEIVEETAETKLVRNGNGAVLRWWKAKSGTPEHVDFLVKDRAGWEEHIRPKLVRTEDDARRIDPKGYVNTRAKCERENLFFCWCGLNVFECLHPVAGHEHMLIGMALDPGWIKDMCTVYADLTIRLMERLFADAGKPDGIWFCEDMGFKERPFMSPAMYREIVWPAHKRTFDHAHSLGLPVIVHSCGFVEPLVPGLIEAGMDCLQAMEAKAGMDLVRLKKNYGDRIAFIGGMDVRTLETNDRAVVQAELDRKLPAAMKGSGYVLATDHSVPGSVNYDTYRFFVDRGREMGTYR